MGEKRPRRFIAGAVCPRCGLMDKTVWDPDTDRRECVSCGFGEERPSAAPSAAAPSEPPTRVSRGAARRRDTPAQVVNLIDPAGSDAD